MNLFKKILLTSLGLVITVIISGCSSNQVTASKSVETPEQFMIKYFSTSDVDTLASYTLEGDDYKAILNDLISKKQLDLNKQVEDFKKNQDNIEFTNLDSDKDIQDGYYVRVRMSMKNQTDLSDNQVRINYLKKVGDTYKIDRKASKGVNDMSFMEYKVNAVRKNQTFRVYAKLDGYYNYEFRDGITKYYSIKLSESDPNAKPYFTGYIDKTSVDGQKLYDILKDNTVHAISVEISVPDNIKLGNDIVVINKLVSDSWLIKD